MIRYTLRTATCTNTTNPLFILECHNGLTFEGSNTAECIDAMMAYYGA